MSNLSNKSIQLLEESKRDYWHIINNPFNQPEKANKSLSNFHSIVHETQLILCDINKKLVYLQKSNELTEKYLLEEIHRKISKILLEYDGLLRKDVYDPDTIKHVADRPMRRAGIHKDGAAHCPRNPQRKIHPGKAFVRCITAKGI